MSAKTIVVKEYNTSDYITTIETDFLPQEGHRIWIEDVIYTVKQVCHKQTHAGSKVCHPIVYVRY